MCRAERQPNGNANAAFRAHSSDAPGDGRRPWAREAGEDCGRIGHALAARHARLRLADRSLQAKEVPLKTFFHKIVMIRNNLRVMEQKVNANEKLSDADKFDLQ